MKGKSVQNICIILFLVLGTTVTQAGAAVINVDANGGGNYSSIQEAVDKAQNGDTILVSPGVYQENIKVNKELIIASDSAPTGKQVNRTYIVGAIPDNDVFYINSNNVTIEGFYISGGPSEVERQEVGIYLEGVKNCSLSNNTLVLNDMGILLSGAQGNYLDSNFVSLGNDGISLINSEANVLSGNLVVKNNQGISLNNSANNTVVNNTAGSNAIGVFLGMSRGNTLAYNTISKNNYGIRGQNAQSNSLFNNSVYMNGIGVDLNTSSNNAIYENEFVNFLNAIDDGNNIWNSSLGNFWDNYTGNDTDGNGIGDIPYVINPTTGSTDYMPLMNVTFSDSEFEK
jgi:nitrous oxidase accessory protein